MVIRVLLIFATFQDVRGVYIIVMGNVVMDLEMLMGQSVASVISPPSFHQSIHPSIGGWGYYLGTHI